MKEDTEAVIDKTKPEPMSAMDQNTIASVAAKLAEASAPTFNGDPHRLARWCVDCASEIIRLSRMQ